MRKTTGIYTSICSFIYALLAGINLQELTKFISLTSISIIFLVLTWLVFLLGDD